MSHRDSLGERIRRGEPLSPPLDLALRALTPLQRIGMALRHRKQPVRVDAHVISIGNLTAGGTGKTPAVIAYAQKALDAGKRVAVLTRGYGSARTPEPLLLDEDPRTPGLFRRFGDEPVLIARKAPGVLVIKDRDRVRGAQRAIELGYDVLILDDGYQSVRLARDEDVLLVDATNPFGNGHLLPAGILREPPSAAARATEIVLTRCDQASGVDALVARLRALNATAPIRETQHAPVSLWRVCDGEEISLDVLRSKTVTAACAIAAPERFVQTLEALGAHVEMVDAYGDHEPFLPTPNRSSWVITTEKDAVRMEHAHRDVYALSVELRDYPLA
jgi:tetraacyldisaccharide 4'-kinase